MHTLGDGGWHEPSLGEPHDIGIKVGGVNTQQPHTYFGVLILKCGVLECKGVPIRHPHIEVAYLKHEDGLPLRAQPRVHDLLRT